MSPIVLNLKGTSLRGNTSVEPKSVKIGLAVRPRRSLTCVPIAGSCKKAGESKKSQSRNISPIWGEAPPPLYRLKRKFA